MMMRTKYILLLSCLFVSASAYADKLGQVGIVRKDDGSIHYMNHYDAMKACPAGTHLPTIRELAKDYQELGAKGILELSEVKSGVPEEYSRISAINPDGSKDEFYFNYGGYKRPQGDLGSHWFWSSSSRPLQMCELEASSNAKAGTNA